MINKWTAVILVIMSIVCINCSSNPANQSTVAMKEIVGNWEKREQVSSMRNTYPAGNGNCLQFNANDYKKYEEGALVQSGQYRVVPDSSASREVGLELDPAEFTHRIIFDNDTTAPKTFFQIKGKQLVLLSGFFPSDAGVQTTYEKVD